jgi:predicted metal-dependent enzyme (double-stranded beta helix superfamily)
MIIVKDWLVTDEGKCEARPSAKEWKLIRDNYYFHRFLTEIVDLIETVANEEEEWDYLPQIRMRVRQLITNSYWLHTQSLKPCSKTGVSILTLYDEIGYPLTVQNVCFSPGVISPIHNHGTWGVVALLKGQEKHTFWQRLPDPDFPDRIEQIGERILTPGEIISFTPSAIHQVETVGNEPALTFHIYGDTQPRSRFAFDPVAHTAKSF